MTDSKCPFCDPEFYIVYGKCKKCGIETRTPLFNMEGLPSIGFLTEKGSRMMKDIEQSQRKYNESKNNEG